MHLHPDSQLIDRLGSTTEVAAMFEVRPQAVSQWRKTGIPKPRRQTMALMRPDLFKPHEGAPAGPGDTPQGAQPLQVAGAAREQAGEGVGHVA